MANGEKADDRLLSSTGKNAISKPWADSRTLFSRKKHSAQTHGAVSDTVRGFTNGRQGLVNGTDQKNLVLPRSGDRGNGFTNGRRGLVNGTDQKNRVLPRPGDRGFTNGRRGLVNGNGFTNGRQGLVNGNGFTNGRRGLVNGNGFTNGRRGLVNGNGFTNGRGLVNGNGFTNGRRGLVNGNGFTNGRGLVNGNGFTNGRRGLVNGNGIINGNGLYGYSDPLMILGVPSFLPNTSGFSRSSLSRILVSLVIFLILLWPPVTVMLGMLQPQSGFVMDGSFDDWDQDTFYSDTDPNPVTESNVDLDKYGVALTSGNLHFYVSVKGSMFSGSGENPDNVFILIDSDRNADTGYTIYNLGVDYMVTAWGKGGFATSSRVSRFDSSANFENIDWTDFSMIGNARVGVGSKAIEFTMPLYLIDNAPIAPMRVVFVTRSSQGSGDVSNMAISLSPGALSVSQTFKYGPDSTVVVAGQEERLLTLEVTSAKEPSTITSIDVGIPSGAVHITPSLPTIVSAGSSILFNIAVNGAALTAGEAYRISFKSMTVTEGAPYFIEDGTGASFYAQQAPIDIVIDGAFADWTAYLPTLQMDAQDPVTGNIDIQTINALSSSDFASFYVGIDGSTGRMMGGTDMFPLHKKGDASATSSSSGSPTIPVTILEHTGVDTLRVLIWTESGGHFKIEIEGKQGQIASRTIYSKLSSGLWASLGGAAAANDGSRMELQVSMGLITGGNITDVRFEMTDWKGSMDSTDKFTNQDFNGLLARSPTFDEPSQDPYLSSDMVTIVGDGPSTRGTLTVTGENNLGSGVSVQYGTPPGGAPTIAMLNFTLSASDNSINITTMNVTHTSTNGAEFGDVSVFIAEDSDTLGTLGVYDGGSIDNSLSIPVTFNGTKMEITLGAHLNINKDDVMYLLIICTFQTTTLDDAIAEDKHGIQIDEPSDIRLLSVDDSVQGSASAEFPLQGGEVTVVPEFSDAFLPLSGFMIMGVAMIRRRRKKLCDMQ